MRPQPPYRRDAFCAGLEACGYTIASGHADVLVIWNRYGQFESLARQYEQAGKPVIVVENGYLGREWRGGTWYAISRTRHNGGGTWHHEETPRWPVDLKPWRVDGEHVLVLMQRGIGSPPVAQPSNWRPVLKTDRPIIVRRHPGKEEARPLADDLKNAWCCVTWGSGAGIKAIQAGVPVFHAYPDWIGAPAARPLGHDIEQPFLGDRGPMFSRLSWAQWELDEIGKGRPFQNLL